MSLHWKKNLGQHLLHDHNILRKIVAALRLEAGEHVLEIGGGSGALTRFLVDEPVQVTSVEIDPQFFGILKDDYGHRENFSLVKGDILKLDLREQIPQLPKKQGKNVRWVVTGNVPYSITSQILFRLFEQREYISRMVLTVQKEAARRITAPIHAADRSMLSVVCQFHTDPTVEFTVSRNCFFPKPRVDSAVIRLALKPVIEDIDPHQFLSVVKTCFGSRRKMLRNTLINIPGFDPGELEPDCNLNRRPQELDVADFIEITRRISAYVLQMNSSVTV